MRNRETVSKIEQIYEDSIRFQKNDTSNQIAHFQNSEYSSDTILYKIALSNIVQKCFCNTSSSWLGEREGFGS